MRELLAQLWDEIRGSWRFRWWALATAWAVCAIGWAYVFLMPSVFQASARVYVDSQSVLRPLLKGLALEPDVESNLTIVRQAIVSRSHLEKVARQTDLDLRASNPEEHERLLESLSRRILIETDVHSRSSASDGLYRITFQDTSRAKSVQVVRSLLDSFVEDTLGSKRVGQQDAQRFLLSQIADYEKRLSDAETRLSDFKKQNVGKMPSDKGDYYARLQAEITGLDQARQAFTLAQTRHDALSRQLTGEEPFVFGFDSATGSNSTTSATSGDVAARIREMEHRLEDLLLRYTDKHPEVVAVRNTIAQLKEQQAAELQRLRSGQAATGSLSDSLKSNPVYQSIQVEMKRTEVQMAEMREDVTQREAKVAELKSLVNTVPEVEAQLARLNRDYEVTKTEYEQLVQRLETAKLSEQADATGVVKFQVIDPPAASLRPISPNRLLLLTGVLILALASGVGVAYLLNVIRPVFQNARSLARTTGLQVLGVIGRRHDEVRLAKSRRSALAFSAALAVLLVIFVAVLGLQDQGIRLVEGLTG